MMVCLLPGAPQLRERSALAGVGMPEDLVADLEAEAECLHPHSHPQYLGPHNSGSQFRTHL